MISTNSLVLSRLIKNTFIDVPLKPDDSSSRRSTSAPPGLRFFHSTDADLKLAVAKAVGGVARPAAVPEAAEKPLQRRASWAEPSADAVREDSTSAGGSSRRSSLTSPPRSPSALTMTPLSSKAAPWQPRSVVQDPLPYTFGQEAARLVTALKKAVEDSHLAWQVEVVNQASGWYISIQTVDLSHSDTVLQIAKKALLKAAKESSCTYVLGYLRMPFDDQPNGFNAVLGAMRDENRACWDAYGKGFCCNPGCCQNLHPTCRMQLNVALWV